MMITAFNLTNAVGAAGFLLSLIAYCLIRRISAGGATPSRLYCNARTCFMVGVLKLGIGIFEITYFNSSGGTWWGWILILFSIFWIVRGNTFRRKAASISAGYHSFNHSHSDNEENMDEPQRRLSNAPQVVIVSDNVSINNVSYPSHASMHGGSAPNALQQPMMSQYDQPIIRNAVPPSPFIGSQGNDSYIVPSIPMAITITPRSGTTTPPSIPTIGNEENQDIIDTQPHAEDSIYIEDDDQDIVHHNDEDDGKNEIEPETPKGAERKTSEGNVTFS